MHLILLGVMKKLITLWILGPLKVRLSTKEVNNISKMLLKLRRSAPSEFARKPRLLSDFKFWKATEFRTFLLYTGPIVLKKIFYLKEKPEIYSHFLLLHFAATILVNADLSRVQSNIDYADNLLNRFVKEFPNIYAEKYVSQNVHNLLHICADVKRFGNLDKFSAFRFENYMLTIKKMIRKGEKPLEQIARRYSELEKTSIDSMEIPESLSSSSKMDLQGEHYNGPLTNEIPFGVHQFKILKTETLNLNCNNSKDSCVLLDDGNFAVISNIVQQQSGKICLIGKLYLPIEKLYHDLDSSFLNIHYASQSQSSNNHLIHVDNVVTKAWKVPCKSRIIVLPLAHNLE
ncbi:uncharacterized protein LOC127284370 [Leptopilina boulardi]|uniref:uncharacterized protein LOC127284370 n=1 Tax=Leptopilina boulardi TaxID=63433 RepID=UPI0021F5F4A2|nr:uncharacterized protein LOC127284370 [Leptopilina boulardi]XP_051165728.1 uncharacterized protein LOC127284370 [Leptopilina boulardi]